MLAFGIAAAAKPDAVVDMLSYTGNLTDMARDAGFSLVEIIQRSAVFLIVMGAIVAFVGLFGCVGACCRVKCMLGVVSCAMFTFFQTRSVSNNYVINRSKYEPRRLAGL